MYEKQNKHNPAVRELKFSQGRRNESESRALCTAIKRHLPYKPLKFMNEMTFRTKHEGDEIFRATSIRWSEHFPYIVPELVSEDGDYMLITWLTYGSLIRLFNAVR